MIYSEVNVLYDILDLSPGLCHTFDIVKHNTSVQVGTQKKEAIAQVRDKTNPVKAEPNFCIIFFIHLC